MPHHAIEVLFTRLVLQMAGHHFFVVAPIVAVLAVCLIYAPVAYFMMRSENADNGI